jgi:hypothetical protein
MPAIAFGVSTLRGLRVPVGSVFVEVALNEPVVKRVMLADEPTHDKREKNWCDPPHVVSSLTFYGQGRGIWQISFRRRGGDRPFIPRSSFQF